MMPKEYSSAAVTNGMLQEIYWNMNRGDKRQCISTENDATTVDTDDSTDITGMDDSTSTDDH